MNYTVYNPDNGQIVKTFTTVDPELVDLNLQNQVYIEGLFDSTKFYIDNGQPVAIPSRPISDYIVYNFDWTSKEWIIETELTKQNIRNNRNDLLIAVDRVNPVWYSTLTSEQQQELQAYRQALLDVPEQSGFPSDVTWPAKPAWL